MTELITNIFAFNPYVSHTLIENSGFREAINYALPVYTMPNWRTLRDTLLPAKREILKNIVLNVLTNRLDCEKKDSRPSFKNLSEILKNVNKMNKGAW